MTASYSRKAFLWDPQPPEDFKKWWGYHPDSTQHIDVKVAWNCQSYRDQWSEAVASVAPEP